MGPGSSRRSRIDAASVPDLGAESDGKNVLVAEHAANLFDRVRQRRSSRNNSASRQRRCRCDADSSSAQAAIKGLSGRFSSVASDQQPQQRLVAAPRSSAAIPDFGKRHADRPASVEMLGTRYSIASRFPIEPTMTQSTQNLRSISRAARNNASTTMPTTNPTKQICQRFDDAAGPRQADPHALRMAGADVAQQSDAGRLGHDRPKVAWITDAVSGSRSVGAELLPGPFHLVRHSPGGVLQPRMIRP